MEAILLIIVIWVVFWGIGWLFSAGSRTAGAAARAVTGKGSFSDNMEATFQGMGSLDIRFKDAQLGDDEGEVIVKEIQGKGLFPLTRSARIGFITSVFDKTSGEYEPVISALDGFQESNNVIYQNRIEVGNISPSQGLISWVRLGIVLPEILQPPYGGRREMVAILRMVDLDNIPDITHGFHEPDHPGLLWQKALPFNFTCSEKGYREAAEHREESMALALKIGVAVAMADGSLDNSEGNVLKGWVLRMIEPHAEGKKESLKKLYNQAMKDAYAEIKSGNLILSSLTQRLNEIGEITTKYEVIELCFSVMAADGVADAEEIKIIRKVAEALDLNLDEIEKMRDKAIIGLNANVSSHASIEDLLGIESNWNNTQIKQHLRKEFQKWNNRLNALPESEERANAQRMLDIIAEARKKYD